MLRSPFICRTGTNPIKAVWDVLGTLSCRCLGTYYPWLLADHFLPGESTRSCCSVVELGWHLAGIAPEQGDKHTRIHTFIGKHGSSQSVKDGVNSLHGCCHR